MSLLDKRNEYVGDLPDPLVPLPNDMLLINDVYYCGLLPSKRWRSWIDAEKWDPKETHDKLLATRNYRARLLLEICIIENSLPEEWLIFDSLDMLKGIAHCEFRISEIRIATYQLTCGIIGIKAKKRIELYHCAVNIFTLIVLLGKIVFEGWGKKDNAAYTRLMEYRPKPSDKKAELAKCIDRGLHTLKEFLDNGALILRQVENEGYVKDVGERLRLIVIRLDEILYIKDE